MSGITVDSLALLQGDGSKEVRPPDRKIRVLGIDLGTTNSTVAEVVVEGQVTSLPPARCLEIEQFTPDGDHTHLLVPSVVALHGGREIVGEGAKRLRASASENGLVQNVSIFYDCKNDIGIRKTYHKAPAAVRGTGWLIFNRSGGRQGAGKQCGTEVRYRFIGQPRRPPVGLVNVFILLYLYCFQCLSQLMIVLARASGFVVA